MVDITPRLKSLHALYCSLTGRDVRFDWRALELWQLWAAQGWTEEDLILVVNFIKRKIQARKRNPESFRLYNLADLGRFEDDLVDARNEARKPKYSPRAAVLKASGRPGGPPPPPAKTAAQIMAESKALEDFQKWRKESGL